MQALILTPDTLPVKPNTWKITWINPAWKFQSEGFTIQFSGIDELKEKYIGWVEVTISDDMKEEIAKMDIPTLVEYLQNLVTPVAEQVENIISPREGEFA